ncbi:WhiB family transcriptional regulator [Gordonia sp. 'Campus']|uniref:WhiB family transcriptional regulator n=1 Tax=Gordonia sp. 'Campus' TaxID=2915824 RepID=UPI001EE3CAB4|nr:WhiB family transcriptional regulator [Gordonia sp. 'Campus']
MIRCSGVCAQDCRNGECQPDLTAGTAPETVTPPCSSNPEAWFPDQAADVRSAASRHALDRCIRCPIRSHCARLALDGSSFVTGIWAGVYIPPAGKQHSARAHALRRLQSVGYPEEAAS